MYLHAQERIAEMATDKKTMDKRMRVVHSFNTRLTRRVEKNGLDLLNLGRYQALLKLISVKSWAQRWKVFRRVKDLHASFFLVAAMLKHFRALSTRLDGYDFMYE